MNKLFLIAVGVIALFAIIFLVGKSSPSVLLLDSNSFISKYREDSDSVMVDVRTPVEFSEGHIAGAINIDFQNPNFATEIGKLDQSKKYFVYCQSGNRSGQAVRKIQSLGLKNIFELRGGLNSAPELIQSSNVSDDYVIDPSDILNSSTFSKQSISGSVLNNTEKTSLLRMREEEKLAHDVYQTLGDKWNLKVFSNIASSEMTHANSVKAVIQTYGIKDPIIDNAVGVFVSKEFQDLYNNFVKDGQRSLQDALIVGAIIEDMDIYDLDRFIKEIKNQDLLVLYKNLQKGSRNHLRAYARNIQSHGGNYVPKYISNEMFRNIISTDQERGYVN